ncbi:VanW family protein [Paenibacillus sp. LHD-117]|uniref:VanW family protein n=1 Tax=Paenibacillus sp. LHD-117 TaxID=3071412 RepID=UPI0027DF9B1C|nr:VanW family protein [Paenibacillus sp. LHD-117]MDQ6422484.1 VanW family protein [Paenibacillus sp. LHD-117]
MKKLRITLVSLLSVLLLVAAVAGVLVWNYAKQDTVPEGVTVGNMALGGMPIDDALAMLSGYEKSLLERTVTVRAGDPAGDSRSWTVAELGYRAQFDAVRIALLGLREGSVWDRAVYRYKFPRSYSLAQSWDRETFDTAVRKQWSWMEEGEPKDATRTITDDDKVVYEPHKDAYRLDIGVLSKQVDEWVVINEADIGSGISDNEAHFVAELPVKTVHPEVTLEKLKAEGIDRKILSFTTDFASSAAGRAHNVTVTAETLNDWHLAPGEVFSYSKLIAMAEKEHEYREAPVILNGKLVPGIGGGICQVSSTLYQAVLRAGLEIVERRNHSLPVAYLPLGHDATYATDAIDFKFRNSTGKHLIIRTVAEDRKLTVKLFGTMPEDVSYDIESVTLKTVEPDAKQTVNPKLPVGEQVVVEQGKPGYVVETFRTLMQDGKAVSRERVSRDTYRAQPTIIEVGPSSLSATPAPSAPSTDEPILEDGL